MYEPDGLEVEFDTASERTKALVTVNFGSVRPEVDNDLVSVRPFSSWGLVLWAIGLPYRSFDHLLKPFLPLDR